MKITLSFKSPVLLAIVLTIAHISLLVTPEGINLRTSSSKAKHNIDSVTLTCTVQFSAPLPSSYRFYHNNKLVQETSNNTYTMDPVVAADEGTYICEPVNVVGSWDNAEIFLEVEVATPRS